MSIARVQDVGAVSNAVAFGGNNTSGNLLVACIQASADVTGVTDTAGNTWTKAVDLNNAGTVIYGDIWYVPSCVSGANTVTAANGFGSSFCHIWVGEYSGCDTSSPLDKTASHDDNAAGAAAFDSGDTATTTAADELLVGMFGNLSAASATWTEPDTEQYDDTTAGASRALSVADQIVSATGAYGATGSSTSGSGWQALIATFKAAAGGGGGVFNPYYYRHLAGGGSL